MSQQTLGKRPNAGRHVSQCLSCCFHLQFLKTQQFVHVLSEIWSAPSSFERPSRLTFLSGAKMSLVGLIFSLGQNNILRDSDVFCPNDTFHWIHSLKSKKLFFFSYEFNLNIILIRHKNCHTCCWMEPSASKRQTSSYLGIPWQKGKNK